MPYYDRRKTELRERLTALGPQLSGTELVRLTGVLDNLFPLWDAALTALYAIVTDEGNDELARDYNEKLESFRKQLSATVSNGLSSLSDPSRAAVTFLERISTEDDIFFTLLAPVMLGNVRDLMLMQVRYLDQIVEALDAKWAKFKYEDSQLEQAEWDTAVKIKQMIEKTLYDAVPAATKAAKYGTDIAQSFSIVKREIDRWCRTVAEGAGVPKGLIDMLAKATTIAGAVAMYIKMAENAGLAPDVVIQLKDYMIKTLGGYAVDQLKALIDPMVKSAMDQLKDMVDYVKPYADGLYGNSVQEYVRQMSNEGALIVCFTGMRADLDAFIRKNGLNITRPVWEATQDRLSTWASSSSFTDGQRGDATAFAKDARDKLTSRWAVVNAKFEAAFKKYEGRLLGSVTTDTERELLRTTEWTPMIDGLVAYRLDERLLEWRQSVNIVHAKPKESLDGINDAFLGLPLEIQSEIRQKVNDYLGSVVQQLNGQVEQTARVLEASALVANAKKLSTDLERRALSAALRA